MKRIGPETREVFDVEFKAYPYALLKGVGNYCKCGCKKHIFGRKGKEFYNSSCRRRYYEQQSPDRFQSYKNNLTCKLYLKKNNKGERFLTIYLKKGCNEKLVLSPKYKELMKELDRIERLKNYGE